MDRDERAVVHQPVHRRHGHGAGGEHVLPPLNGWLATLRTIAAITTRELYGVLGCLQPLSVGILQHKEMLNLRDLCMLLHDHMVPEPAEMGADLSEQIQGVQDTIQRLGCWHFHVSGVL